MSLVKYRLREVASDFGVAPKEISEIIGGSVLVEQVFSYPGLGQAAVTAGLGSDVPLLLGITVVTAVLAASGNLAASILYGIVDPRIRKGAAR